MESNREKTIEERAAEARREYYRKWRAENKDKVRAKTKRYWERKALKAMEEATHGEQ